jgi:predicted phosphodiesterase
MEPVNERSVDELLPPRIGVFSDIHGELRALERALLACGAAGVGSIAVLGDLFDRVEEADRVAGAFEGWDVFGVYGNHEREVALAAAAGELALLEATTLLLSGLQAEITVGDVRLVHHDGDFHHDPVAQLFSRSRTANGHSTQTPWITFHGHTHVRRARSEHGPLDISRGRISLSRARRYDVNPGALSIGQFIIWDREEQTIRFLQLEDW